MRPNLADLLNVSNAGRDCKEALYSRSVPFAEEIEYATALSDYNDKVRQGLTLEEKEQILNKISNKFSKTGVDLSTVKREMKSLEIEKIRARKDFDLSMNFYQRLGATIIHQTGDAVTLQIEPSTLERSSGTA